MTIDLGTIQTFLHQNFLLLALDKKLIKYNKEKPLEFHLKISDDGKIVLVGPCLVESTKTGVVNLDNG